jgi:uncharacterized protein (DUF1778 family)
VAGKQLNAVIEAKDHQLLRSAAEILGITVSDLVRDIVVAKRPTLIQEAEQRAAQRRGYRQITRDHVDKAANDLANEFSKSGWTGFAAADVFGPKGKAIWELLCVVWGAGDKFAAHQDRLDEVAARVAAIQVPKKVKPPPKPPGGGPPDDERPIRPYRRKDVD